MGPRGQHRSRSLATAPDCDPQGPRRGRRIRATYLFGKRRRRLEQHVGFRQRQRATAGCRLHRSVHRRRQRMAGAVDRLQRGSRTNMDEVRRQPCCRHQSEGLPRSESDLARGEQTLGRANRVPGPRRCRHLLLAESQGVDAPQRLRVRALRMPRPVPDDSRRNDHDEVGADGGERRLLGRPVRWHQVRPGRGTRAARASRLRQQLLRGPDVQRCPGRAPAARRVDGGRLHENRCVGAPAVAEQHDRRSRAASRHDRRRAAGDRRTDTRAASTSRGPLPRCRSRDRGEHVGVSASRRERKPAGY